MIQPSNSFPKPPKPVFTFDHPQEQSMTPPNTLNPDDQTTDDRLTALEQNLRWLIQFHKHDGGDAQRINFNTDILGLFETVSVAPTGVPKSPFDQVKIYVNSTTYRLYWYDGAGNVWHYVTATA